MIQNTSLDESSKKLWW